MLVVFFFSSFHKDISDLLALNLLCLQRVIHHANSWSPRMDYKVWQTSRTHQARVSSLRFSLCPMCPERPLCSGDRLGALNTVLGRRTEGDFGARGWKRNFVQHTQNPFGDSFGLEMLLAPHIWSLEGSLPLASCQVNILTFSGILAFQMKLDSNVASSWHSFLYIEATEYNPEGSSVQETESCLPVGLQRCNLSESTTHWTASCPSKICPNWIAQSPPRCARATEIKGLEQISNSLGNLSWRGASPIHQSDQKRMNNLQIQFCRPIILILKQRLKLTVCIWSYQKPCDSPEDLSTPCHLQIVENMLILGNLCVHRFLVVPSSSYTQNPMRLWTRAKPTNLLLLFHRWYFTAIQEE
jgi:hypothetical protein